MRWSVVPAWLWSLGLAGCAAMLAASCGKDAEALDAARVPVPPRARVLAQSYQCPVSPSQCFRYVIVASDSTLTGARLKASERVVLERAGWRFREGVTRHAVAADSPDRRVFISFETGREELLDERSGRFEWSSARMVERLRTSVASTQPVLAITLEPGDQR